MIIDLKRAIEAFTRNLAIKLQIALVVQIRDLSLIMP
jgi:hypothetical protein